MKTAARVLLAGGTQEDAAKEVRVRRETVSVWTRETWWRDIEQATREEADLEDFAAECLAVVRAGVRAGDAHLAAKMLERLDLRFVAYERRTPKTGDGETAPASPRTLDEARQVLDFYSDRPTARSKGGHS